MAGLDSNVKLLLHFDGADGTTSTTDTSDSAHVLTPVADAQIDTAQSKFGGSAALFDGTGDYYSAPDSTDWDLHELTTTPMTIDFWVRFSSLASHQGLCGQEVVSIRHWELGWFTDGTLILGLRSGADSGQLKVDFAPVVDTWYHIAVVRDATTRYVFIDGVSQTLIVDIEEATGVITGPFLVGQDPHTGSFLDGWIDEFRLSDVARWTSNFTPPTEAYGPDTNNVAISLPVFWQNNPNIIQFPTLSVQAGSGATGVFSLPLLGVTSSGTPANSMGDIDLPLLVISGTGVVQTVDGTITLPIMTASAIGSFFGGQVLLPLLTINATTIDNQIAIELPALTVSAEQFIRVNGSITLPRPTFYTVAQQGHVEELDISLPMITLSAFSGHPVGLTLPQFIIAAEGKNGYVGIFSKSLPRMTVNAKASQQNVATFIKSLPKDAHP